ncbi:uncharacterized protein [Rutidosis leptorrhynchoides]|uniref:uncharacterized protein n=1 Tax=Rutidosis leptorrhynchoides TaxID=125765 RepID=UPI003A99F5A2
MDCTPSPPIHQPNPISSYHPSSGKLPIKRKTLTSPELDSSHDVITTTTTPTRHSPFKFHRVWTEPDEIRLLQGLLDCSSQGFSFPRDLALFHDRFSTQMSSQSYSKTQLSEKLRRLRKKFRSISSRISKGFDESLLSPQDRALYDLSKQLWEPEINNLNTNSIDDYNIKSNFGRTRVRLNLSPNLPSPSTAVLALPSVVKKPNTADNSASNSNKYSSINNNNFKSNNINNVSGVDKVELERNVGSKVRVGDFRSEIVRFASKALVDVVDQSLKEIKMMIDVKQCFDLEKELGFEKRWRDQYVEEFDVLTKRLKLIVEHKHSSVVSK